MSKARGRQISRNFRQGKVQPTPHLTAALKQAMEFHQRGQLAEAETLYRDILQRMPNNFDALHSLSLVTHQRGRHEEAHGLISRALAINPKSASALSNYGLMLSKLKRHEDALASYERALAIKPDFAEALNNRGTALRDLKRHEDALASYDRALAIKPDYAEALYNRGNALRDLKRHEDALTEFERLLIIKPDYEYALGNLHHLRMHCCMWGLFEQHSALISENVRMGKLSSTPFSFLAVSDSPSDQLRCSQKHIQHKYPASIQPVWKGERYSHERIRIAYVSADFHDHPMAFLMAGLFEQHDRSRFETTAISFSPESQSEMRRRLEQAFDRFIDVRRKSDREVANLLRELEIDIAIDRKGFTTDGRTGIFALRPAPIQVNYLAYPGTIGADYIDYILADRFVIPEDQHAYYSEKVVYLPDTYQVNDSKRRIAEQTPTRAEVGLPETGFVFCCFNNNYKITPRVFDVWMRLLRKVEGSVLWLLKGNAAVVRNLRREAAQRDVAPARLVFAPRTKLEDHLARHRLANLFLDTLPYNAHTSSSDALWAGLPVLTCMGNAFAGRVAASLLNAVGLPELITQSLEEYEALALKLASDRKRLAEISAKLAVNRATHPLFDTDRFRRHIEQAFTTMWERYQRGEPPASFTVQPLPVVDGSIWNRSSS